MAEFKLYFSVLKYIPSPIRRESINVGVVFHIPEMKISRFQSIKSTNRLSSFDDEYDKEFFKLMMDSFHYEFDYPTSINNELSANVMLNNEVLSNPDFLRQQTNDYSNEFQFDAVNTMYTSDSDYVADINDLIKTYLYYDRPKSERITAPEVRRLLSKQLRLTGFKHIQRKPDIPSDFDNKSLFDFQIGDYFIKVISFDYAHSTTMAKEIKSALYDLDEATNNFDISRIKIVVNDASETSNKQAYNLFAKKVEQYMCSKNNNIEIVSLSKFTSSKF